ncbi:MAG: hypothetical protein GY804_12520 [Alphaproteobacteria bacterium]|nr:hypothetical protein [Alphaproteobacteria bacterium]
MKTKIGPSKAMFISNAFFSKFSILLYIGMILGFNGVIGDIPESIVEYYAKIPIIGALHPNGLLWFGSLFALFILTLKSLIMYSTTNYHFNEEDNIITIKELYKGSFMTDTIMLSQVYDCDITSSVFQAIIGSGDLVVTTVDKRLHVLQWLPKVEQVREEVTSRSGGKNMRPVGMV